MQYKQSILITRIIMQNIHWKCIIITICRLVVSLVPAILHYDDFSAAKNNRNFSMLALDTINVQLMPSFRFISEIRDIKKSLIHIFNLQNTVITK